MKCNKQDICAVVVTYNCDSSIYENINKLKLQVGHIIVVDNHSSEKSIELLENIKKYDDVTILYNNFNFGIGHALNQGLNYAKLNKYKLLLTMDQDSRLGENAVEAMIEVLNNNKEIVSVGPRYLTNTSNYKKSDVFETVSYLITSGNLTYIENILNVEGFNEELFIDCVDFDFSLSIRDMGGKLCICNNAFMEHKIGEGENGRFLFFNFNLYSHEPVRHYYMFRNHYYIQKTYIRTHFIFCLKKEFFSMVYVLNVLFLQSKKKEKLIMAYRGVRDAKRNQYGIYKA